MKVSCEIIKDLLPLYAEKLTSEDSNAMIREHLGECSQCAEMLKTIKSEVVAKPDEPPIEGNPLRYVKEGIKKRKHTTVIFGCLCVFLLVFTIFSYISRPRYVSYEDSGVTVTKGDDNQVYISFGANVSSCRVTKGQSINGRGMEYEVEAWTSTMDKILGTATSTLALSEINPHIDTVYYCDYTKDINNPENVRIIYGINPISNGGMTVLPRLVLRAYFMLALISIPVIGVAWVLFRNKKKLSKVLKYVFFMPVSYVISNLPLFFSSDLLSFGAARDFFINVIGAAAIYGIIISGLSLLKQHRQDTIK